MSIFTLEALTKGSGFIADGDWIESKDQDPNGGIRLIQLADIGDRQFLNKSQRYINEKTLHQLNCTLLHEGDVLIARMPDPLGRACVFPKLDQPAITAVDICIVRPNSELADSDWLSFVLNTPKVRQEIQSHAQGATRARVPTGKLKQLELNCPTVAEQRQIAARLKDQLAEIETARQAAQVQLSDTRLLRSRMLKAFFAELDAAPKKRLGDYAHISSGVTPARDNSTYWQPPEVAWVKTGEIDFSPISTVKESISRKALAECSLSLLPPKTVLIAITGEGKTRGRSAVLEVSATTNQHSVAVLPNVTWDANFLQLWMQSSYLDLRELSEGRGGSRSALSGAQIKALEVPAPSKTEQQHIVARIQAVMTAIDAVENSSKAALEGINRLPNRVLAQAFGV
jgi:type I restriction enzyme S subunit